jgi:hypothetical protein
MLYTGSIQGVYRTYTGRRRGVDQVLLVQKNLTVDVLNAESALQVNTGKMGGVAVLRRAGVLITKTG